MCYMSMNITGGVNVSFADSGRNNPTSTAVRAGVRESITTYSTQGPNYVRASGVSDRTVALLRAPHDATLSL